MLARAKLVELLGPCAPDLGGSGIDQVSTYMRLLMRWNERINLTAIREEEEVVTRHFGESLFLAKLLQLNGALLDVGSGAGFPGLALKIVFPNLAVTLLEPVGKKRAFLKEVARGCGFRQVEVRGERLADFVHLGRHFDTVTARAVGHLDDLAPLAGSVLLEGGQLALWLSCKQAVEVGGCGFGFEWETPIFIPCSQGLAILVGRMRRQPFGMQHSGVI